MISTQRGRLKTVLRENETFGILSRDVNVSDRFNPPDDPIERIILEIEITKLQTAGLNCDSPWLFSNFLHFLETSQLPNHHLLTSYAINDGESDLPDLMVNIHKDCFGAAIVGYCMFIFGSYNGVPPVRIINELIILVSVAMVEQLDIYQTIFGNGTKGA